MITPTVGRRVWYWPLPTERSWDHDQPFDAGIAYVHSDTGINISYANDIGTMGAKSSVVLVQGDEKPLPGQCSWMPYQKGQAAKADGQGSGQTDRRPSADTGFGSN